VDADELDQLQEATFANATAATRASYAEERRLRGDALCAYLDGRAFATISSTRNDGRPHATLTSYFRRGTAFWLPTVAGSVRERNVQRQPWLVLVVTEGDHDDHVAVIVEGPVVVVPGDEAPADLVAQVGDWATRWLRLDAARLLSYAAEGTRIEGAPERT
jgi:hypothetical protein